MPPNPDATPKLFKHTLKLYQLLEEESANGIYTGYKGKTFLKLKLSPAYQPRLYKLLTDLGCIEQTFRGSVALPSQIKLIHPPELEAWREFHEDGLRLTKRQTYAKLMEMIQSVERRLPPGVDVGQYIISLETRLASIEADVAALKVKGGTDFAS